MLVIAKEPLPGRVKTRLTPPYTPEQAARLAEASLTDTLRTGLRVPARRRVLALAGRPGPWLPPGWEVVPQGTGGLDERIAAALARCSGPTLLLGMDTPQITPELLAPATAPDAGAPDAAWFGPARDGGFWALGLGEPDPGLVRGVPMSTVDTGAEQRRRLVAAGLRVADLPELEDMDTVAEADRIAARVAPDSRFAEIWGRTVPGAPAADPGSPPRVGAHGGEGERA
ncbi:TIGR04282 family arsenosugar biosynthesis glycosyltransferase [Streptomyces calidiresistens]